MPAKSTACHENRTCKGLGLFVSSSLFSAWEERKTKTIQIRDTVLHGSVKAIKTVILKAAVPVITLMLG